MLKTGYTANMIEEDMTFTEFTMSCARAFGYLIDMRDEPMNAEIADIEPDNYYKSALSDAKNKMKELNKMSKSQIKKYFKNKVDKEIKFLEKEKALEEKEYNKVQHMLEQVKKWEPPTKEHVALKKFMIEQLEDAELLHYYDDRLNSLQNYNPIKMLEKELKDTKENIIRYTKYIKEEENRCKRRNKWINALKENLKSVK